jgi:hypothetical protein
MIAPMSSRANVTPGGEVRRSLEYALFSSKPVASPVKTLHFYDRLSLLLKGAVHTLIAHKMLLFIQR